MIDFVLTRVLELAAASAVHNAYEEILTHKGMLLKVLSTGLVARDQKIRVSFAEILRLTHENRYVLIANKKRPGRYTPIGGVIRCFPSGLKHLQETFHYIPENSGGDERLDLRGYVTGRAFPKTLKWFYSESGRERQALAREISEELQEIGFKTAARRVKNPEFNLIRVVHEGPMKIRGVDYLQYRFFLVKELVGDHSDSKILSEAIAGCLASTQKLITVSTDEIRLGRAANGAEIGDSAGYLFGGEPAGSLPGPRGL